MTEIKPLPLLELADARGTPRPYFGLEVIDWLMAVASTVFWWIYQVAIIPLGMLISLAANIAVTVVDAWNAHAVTSKFVPAEQAAQKGLLASLLVPFFRAPLVSVQGALRYVSNFLISWMRPVWVSMANLGLNAFGPLGTLLSEGLALTLLLRQGSGLLAPLFGRVLAETEKLVAVVEAKAVNAFAQWEPSLNLAISWCNWAFDPSGFFRVDAWISSVVQYAGDTIKTLLLGLATGRPPAETLAALQQQFPLRPQLDFRAAFVDGRTRALPQFQAAVARFKQR